jgi:protein involved in polysaccharide export with SLBB domain
LFLVLFGMGCADKIRTATWEELAAIERAGPPHPTVDMDLLRRAKLHTGSYRVVPDDVLEFTMPALLQAVTTTEAQAAQTQIRDDRPYICRVSKRGAIALPAVGEMQVAGQTLAEIEENVVNAYRSFVLLRPSVFVRVMEYKTYQTSIVGAVAKPGVYMLRGDQMSLVALLMEAGGIIEDGAAVITISRLNPADAEPSVERISHAPQASVGATAAAQGVHLAAYPQETTAHAMPVLAAGTTVRAVFQREGPLPATGWLALEERGEMFWRNWLDLGSVSQRRLVLEALATRLTPTAMDDLQARLSYLAEFLELRSRAGQVVQATPAPGWEAIGDGRFLASLAQGMAEPMEAVDASDTMVTPTVLAAGEDAVRTLTLPVRGLNIPFRDVGLQEGDTVVVERIQEPLFSVLGLVNRPGNFPYPPNVEYNVTQAIAFAGGLDPVARPRYVTIYRLAESGSIVRVAFKLVEDEEFTEALTTRIKPGDVVAIEHTPRTRANVVIHNMVRITTGLYIYGRDLWD